MRLGHAVRQLAARFEVAARVPRLVVAFLLDRVHVRRLIDNEERALGQVVEQRARREERRVRIDVLEPLARRERVSVVLDALARVPAEVRELHARCEARHARRVSHELARRANAERFAQGGRTLRRGVEVADALHLVTEQLDAQRALFGRRPDVDDAAAAARFAWRGDLRLDAEPGGVERAHQRIERRAFAAHDGDRRPAELVRGDCALGERGGAGHDHRRDDRRRGERVECVEPAADVVRVGREPFVGQRVSLGEYEHAM